MSDVSRAFRALVEEDNLLVIPDCLSAISARIVEDLGFRATYCGGNALGTFHHAIPDYGLLTPSELAGHVERIATAVGIPVLVDADQGGDTVASVRRTVRVFEQAGAAAIHLEDSRNPKHSRLPADLMPIDEMQLRISAAVDARRSDDFMIIARCEGLFNQKIYGEGPSIDEVIERGVAYATAGAEAYMPITMSPADIPIVAAAVPVPVFDINHPLDDVKDTPLKVNIFSGWAGPSAARAHREWATHLLEHGDIPRKAFVFEDRGRLIRQGDYDAVLEAWARQNDRPVLDAGKSLSAYS